MEGSLKKKSGFFSYKLEFIKNENLGYKRMGLIDSGTYGKVFKVKNLKFKKLYACKEIKLTRKGEGFNFITLREINLLLAINHPNIIFVKEAKLNSLAEKFFIVMEYCNFDIKSILAYLLSLII